MEISEVLSEDMILTEVKADSKRQLLAQLSELAAKKIGTDKSVVFEAILERENLGSTGYGNGVAFPHARIEGINSVLSVFARLQKPSDFDAVDSQPVDIIAFLVSPENSGDDHLKALSAFSRVLKNPEVCRSIRQAKSAHEIYVALQK